MTIEQGDPRLLESDLAQRLLRSTIPARYDYKALDSPHVSHATYRLRALRANPEVAVSIDTESFPPEVLSIRGRAEISEIDGVAPEYAEAARRFLGPERAAGL